MAKQTAENWKAAHLQLSSADQASTGLGGLLRVDTVKTIMKLKGYQIQAAQMGGLNPHTATTRKILTKEQVSGLSKTEATAWLRHLNMTVPRLLPDMRAKLLAHFEKQVPGFVVYS